MAGCGEQEQGEQGECCGAVTFVNTMGHLSHNFEWALNEHSAIEHLAIESSMSSICDVSMKGTYLHR